PAKELEEIIERIVDLLRDAGIEVQSLGESERNWEKMARTVEGLARGAMSVADAMGILGDEARRAFQSVIDLAGGIALIASGSRVGGLAQTIGGALGLITAFTGRGDDGEALRRAEEQRRAVEANTEALERLRRDLQALASIVGAIPGASLGGAQRVIATAQRLAGEEWWRSGANPFAPVLWTNMLPQALAEA